MLILMLATIVATSIITSVFYEEYITRMKDAIATLKTELVSAKAEAREAQEICDLGWTDCLCRPGVTDPNCAFLKAQART